MENQDIARFDNIDLDHWNGLKIVGYCQIGNNSFPIIEAGTSLEDLFRKQQPEINLKSQISQFELNGQILAIVESAKPPATNSAEINAEVVNFLTDREMQIASLVAKGNSNKQIANLLSISIWTVSTHLRRIFVKLGVDTRAAMVYRCTDLLL
jgi:DNA-binding CsgD family transcriptional regulator